ncbi:unnamed protein product [Cyclocybe aegerita]|uniref:F-box domain-containing protein n=1 Tax=Cyclocybe aegerita TaxID=1973307 RepID=A0A8S0VRV0_CYCAE|nr:unnamed protein product [Cyclocybe aegerita]
MADGLAGIHHIPDEIFVLIFDQPDVPLETLYNASLVSKRLHYFCLPLFLARFDISDPSEYAEIIFHDNFGGTALDALDGLRVGLYIHHIKHLVCRFQLPGEEGDLEVVIRHMKRLYGLVSSLSSIENVSIFYGSEICCCCSGLDIGETLDEILEEWSRVMGRTLSKMIERGCTAMSLAGGRYMDHTYAFRTGNAKSKKSKRAAKTKGKSTRDQPFSSAFKNLFGKRGSNEDVRLAPDEINILNGESWAFCRAKGTGTSVVLTPLMLGNEEKENSQLKHLTIQSMMVLMPPLLHWTAQTLRLPSVQSLTLKNLQINRKCWKMMFTVLAGAIPTLSELHLSSLRQIVPGDLLKFISSFPRLTSLHIGRDVDCIDAYDLGPFPDFPELISLYAPARWVIKLLGAQRTGLARLESLAIVYNLRNEGFSHWLRKSSGTPTIPILLKEQDRPLTVSLEVYLGGNPGWRMREDVECPTADATRALRHGGGGVGRVECEAERPDVSNVVSLTLVFDEKLKSGDVKLESVLSRWLALFYGVRHLGVRTVPPKAISEEQAMGLLNCVWREGGLAAMSSVELNGNEVDIDEPDTDTGFH